MTVDVGTVLQTSGCNLPCKHVLHVVLPDWMDDSTSSHKVGPGLTVIWKLGGPLGFPSIECILDTVVYVVTILAGFIFIAIYFHSTFLRDKLILSYNLNCLDLFTFISI